MIYDNTFFDAPVDRLGTDCEKWDGLQGREGTHLLPMWVADMDLRCAEEITEALTKRAAHQVYGYTQPSSCDIQAMLDFFQRHHGLTLSPSQQAMLPCVITGLRTAVRTLTAPGDQVIIQPPVYGPFYASIQENDREVAENPLLMDSQGRYTMDLENLEALCCQGKAKLMILCNPHNPVGRCWTREELAALCEVLERYQVALVSDEIHWDFAFDGKKACPVLSLPYAQGDTAPVLTITSASKTFNIAGLQQAVLLSHNQQLLAMQQQEMGRAGVTQGNIFGMVATAAAFRQGDAWLAGLLAYLDESRSILRQEVAARLPKAILSPIEATYLGWLNLRAYGLSTSQLMKRCHQAGVYFNPGTVFGEETGAGFLRINFACPHSQLRTAMERLATALSE